MPTTSSTKSYFATVKTSIVAAQSSLLASSVQVDDDVNKPLFVKYQSEKDRSHILKNTPKLPNFTAAWPKVSIAPDCTKRR